MAYEWRRGLCNNQGIPFAKLANSFLEKTDSEGNILDQQTFLTQTEVDWAWANGYHVPGKPETRDVGPDGELLTIKEATEKVFKPKKSDEDVSVVFDIQAYKEVQKKKPGRPKKAK